MLVVVALDDVELEAHEGTILESHMQDFERQVHIPPRKRFPRRQKPYLESHEDLFRVIRKMMRSSWFRRAWCRHEMRLAREHIFLVPCQSRSGQSVLRFTGKCLTHFLSLATEVPFEMEIEDSRSQSPSSRPHHPILPLVFDDGEDEDYDPKNKKKAKKPKKAGRKSNVQQQAAKPDSEDLSGVTSGTAESKAEAPGLMEL